MHTTNKRENERLEELYRYKILDTVPEEEFDHLLQMAAQICECSHAAISFIDRERQWFKSEIGLGISGTSRDHAFCSHTIEQDSILEVNDAEQDERFAQNPLVTGQPNIRYYAGSAIVTESGFKIGSVCVIDQKPKHLTSEKLHMLQVISQQVAKLLELRRYNQAIQEKAEAQAIMENMILQHTLRHFDEQRFAIGTELHEKIAQDLAATNFILDMAAATPETAQPELLKRSRNQINTVISNLRTLSHTIVPTTLGEGSLADLLQFSINKLAEKGIHSELQYKGTSELPLELSHSLYRMVEHQVENLLEHTKPTTITITVAVGSILELTIHSNGCPATAAIYQLNAHFTQVLARARAYKALVGIWPVKGNKCRFSIRVPDLAVVAATASVNEGSAENLATGSL